MSRLLDTFTTAWRAEATTLGQDVLPSVLARACTHVLSFDAAGLSLMSGPGARVPLGASSEDAAVAERLQFTVGEGPCFSAMHTGRPVVVTEEDFAQQWPALAEQHFTRTPFRGGLSLPLRVGGSRIGVLDLYLHRSRPLDGSDIIDAQDVAAAITVLLLDTLREYLDEHRDHPSSDRLDDEPTGGTREGATGGVLGASGLTDRRPDQSATLSTWLNTPTARRRQQVWIATGMANLALALPSDQALAVLRAHAYASGQSLDTFADDIVTGRFDLTALRLDLPR